MRASCVLIWRGALALRTMRRGSERVESTRALRRFAELYAIKTVIRGQTAVARQARSLLLVTAMKAWLETQLTHIPPRSGLADAVRYARTRWDALRSSSMTGALNSIITRSNGPFAPRHARPQAVPTVGHPSAPSSPPPSSTTSSPSPTSRICWSACPAGIPRAGSTIPALKLASVDCSQTTPRVRSGRLQQAMRAHRPQRLPHAGARVCSSNRSVDNR